LLSQGEGLNIELNKCACNKSSTAYETIYVFLNTKSGDILLGVKDNGKITEIAKEHISSIKQAFVTSVNNTSELSLIFYLYSEKFFIYFCARKFSVSQVRYKDIYAQ